MGNLFKSNYVSGSTDELLVSQAVQGNHKAIEKLIARHQDWIYNIALRMVGEPQDAEDVTQEVLIKIIKNLPGFRQESSFHTWAYRIAANHVLNMKKRDLEKKLTSRRQYSKAIDDTPNMDFPDRESLPVEKTLIIEEIKIHCMMGMLLCLKRKERLVFIVGEIFDFNGPLSCEILDISYDNFRQILSRARRRVYNFMRGQCGLIDKKNSCHCHRKAKAMIDHGDIDFRNLYISGNSLLKLNRLVEKKYCRLDDLVENQCRKLFREQPFFNSPDFVQTFRDILKSSEFKEILNLN